MRRLLAVPLRALALVPLLVLVACGEDEPLPDQSAPGYYAEVALLTALLEDTGEDPQEAADDVAALTPPAEAETEHQAFVVTLREGSLTEQREACLEVQREADLAGAGVPICVGDLRPAAG